MVPRNLCQAAARPQPSPGLILPTCLTRRSLTAIHFSKTDLLLLAESERPASDEASTAFTSSVDRIFGMKTVQRTQCLTGAPDERMRHSRTFQVCCSSCLPTLTKPQIGRPEY